MSIQFGYNIHDPEYPYARCIYEYSNESKNIDVVVQVMIKLTNNICSDLFHSILVLNYTRFDKNKTLANGQIFYSDQFNNTIGIIEYASIYNDSRLSENILFNNDDTITYPITNSAGIFAEYSNGKVIIEYINGERIISVYKK